VTAAALAVLAFCGLLVWAALCDVRSMLIPNRIPALLAAGFAPAAWLCGAPVEMIAFHLGVGLAALGVCFVLFQLNLMGGGDAKLIAAAAVWTGPAALVSFLLAMCLAGGLLSLALIAGRRAALAGMPAPGPLERLLRGETHAPYGVAIAAGGLWAAPLVFSLLAAA
jgi:prepilin peptidase CpaA